MHPGAKLVQKMVRWELNELGIELWHWRPADLKFYGQRRLRRRTDDILL